MSGVRLSEELNKLDPDFGVVLEIDDEQIGGRMPQRLDLVFAEIGKADRELQSNPEPPSAFG